MPALPSPPPPLSLPETLVVLERGWLSANNLLFREADGSATLIDSGYVTHAPQTVALVTHALAGHHLTRLINTHAHSDHMGGNAALTAAFGCQVWVPTGMDAHLAEWDEEALLLSPLGQQACPFHHDGVLYPGDRLSLGGLSWEALGVPGHDMDALAFYNADLGLLISGDALWENGFGVIFPELLGTADGLQATRQTLDQLALLPLKGVIPGHGAPFSGVDEALARAYARLAAFEASSERLARHALKVIVSFLLMEKQQLSVATLTRLLAELSFPDGVNRRYLGLAPDVLAERLVAELQAAGALERRGEMLYASA